MSDQVSLFDVKIDALRMEDVVERIHKWVRTRSDSGCRYVVTPNVDHTVMLQEDEGLQAAYKDAWLVLADGHPVVWASRILRRPLPERVPGSDLVPRLFASASKDRPLRTYLLGAAEGVADRAASNIQSKWSAVEIVGTYSPPLGFEKDEEENARIIAKIAEAKPDVLVVGLGAPKQELWVHRFHKQLDAGVALCVGATIDFLAGEKARAPRWIQSLGMEWFHRMATDPKRLVKRYARDAWVFPQLIWREWRRPI